MKRKIVAVLFMSVFLMPLFAQSLDDAVKQMKSAIATGNYSTLSNLFSDSVDLTIRDTDGIYSKTQAKGVLKSFFENEKPKSFQVKHQGSSNDGTIYAIGSFVSVNRSYRVYALFKEQQGNTKIVQFQIEEEL